MRKLAVRSVLEECFGKNHKGIDRAEAEILCLIGEDMNGYVPACIDSSVDNLVDGVFCYICGHAYYNCQCSRIDEDVND